MLVVFGIQNLFSTHSADALFVGTALAIMRTRLVYRTFTNSASGELILSIWIKPRVFFKERKMENHSILIKGGNKCEIEIKEKEVYTIYNIALKRSKEGNNQIQLMFSSNKGQHGMIGILSEKANM